MVGCLRSAGTGQLVVPRVQTKHGEMAFSHCSAEGANKKVSLHVKYLFDMLLFLGMLIHQEIVSLA